jgi:Transposase IS116/IS110/IS902 family
MDWTSSRTEGEVPTDSRIVGVEESDVPAEHAERCLGHTIRGAEVGDFRRFTNARQLMAYLGLVPSEHSSGSTVRRAGITKGGNALARRVLIEGAWTYRMSARVSRRLHDRLEPLSAAIGDIAWKAQVRLCARYRRLAAIGKPKDVVTTAIARAGGWARPLRRARLARLPPSRQRCVSRPMDSWSPSGRRFPPQDLVPPGRSKKLQFPRRVAREAPPLRPERHGV